MSDLSGSSSDEEHGAVDKDRRLASLVLRPAITTLPSIDNESDDESSLSEAEVIFSNINWDAQQSSELLTDHGLTSPGPDRCATALDTESALGLARAAPAVPQQSSPLRNAPRQNESTCAPNSAPPSSSRSIDAPACQMQLERFGASLEPSLAAARFDEVGAEEPYEGRGWLLGAAGRLASGHAGRRRVQGATDADQVAAAARHAAELQQHKQQQQQLQQQVSAGSEAAPADVELAASAADAAGAVGTEQLRRQQETEELRIDRDFHESIMAAEQEPPLLASSGAGLVLEAPVAGLGVEDLDELIARLRAGMAAVPAGARGAPAEWAATLPAAEDLWSDDEPDDAKGGEARVVAAPAVNQAASAAAPQLEQLSPRGVSMPASSPAAPSAPNGSGPASEASAGNAPGLVVSAPAAPLVKGPSTAQALPPPLPAKFKFLAAPPALGAPPALPHSQPASRSSATSGTAGPVAIDLRHSIAEAAQRNERESAAAVAQRASQAKAAAAQRRLAAESSSDSEDGGSDDAARKERPRPPARQAAPSADASHGAVGPAAQQTPMSASASAPSPPAPSPAPSAQAPAASAPAAGSAAAKRRAPLVDTAAAPLADAGKAPQPQNKPPTDSSPGVRVCNGSGGATASAASKPSASVGTDVADLRPATRSAFVCTAERRSDEEAERLSDIRAYLKARSGAAAPAKPAQEPPQPQAASEAATAASASAAERRWPEPPKEVAQRLSVLAERHANGPNATAANGVAAEPKAQRPRAVATFTGGTDGASEGAATAPLSNGNAVGAAASADAAATAPRAFAACSTEGDENLLAEPAPSSVVDASREKGARLAAAGTVISVSGSSARSPQQDSTSGQANAAAKRGPLIVQESNLHVVGPARPSALQVLSPTSAAAVSSPVGAASTASAAPATSPVPPAKSPRGVSSGPSGGSAARHSAAAAELGRLPPWLSASSCFTLLVTSPRNLPSREVGTILEWLLRAASSATGCPPISIVGARLLGLPTTLPLLPAAVTAASGAGAQAGAGTGEVRVRVLALACVPASGLDPDTCSNQLPNGSATAVAAAAQQLSAALADVRWGDVLGSDPDGSGSGSRTRLGGWVETHLGGEAWFGPLLLAPHALSQAPQPSGHRSSASGAALSPVGGGDAAGSGAFICMVTRGALRQPHLLRGLLDRAACLGLTLRGLQVLYAGEEAAATVVSATPHKPLPHTGAAVLVLSGGNEPLRRWQAQLGPPDAALAARTEPSSLHALYGDAARCITCSYDAAAASREVAVLFAAGGGAGGEALQSPTPVSPRGAHSGLGSNAVAVAGAAFGARAEGETCGLVSSSTAPQSQWLALPACGASQQALALWAAQYMLWCGYGLRGMLLAPAPSPQQTALRVPAGDPTLLLEMSKEEAAEQLPSIMANLPASPAPATAVPTGQAAEPPAPFLTPLMSSEALRAHLPPSGMHSLPPPHVTEQLLSSIASKDDTTRGSAATHASTALQQGTTKATASSLHHGEDEVVVVALQGRPLHAAALVLAALVAHVTAAPVEPGLGSTSGDRLELVACRLLRQVPSEIAGCLGTQYHSGGSGSSTGGAIGASGTLRGPQRLIISQPALLAVLHGPAAQARVGQLLAAAVQRLAPHPGAGAGPELPAASDGSSTGGGASELTAWQAHLDFLLRQYPTAAAVPLLAAVSISQPAAKRALAHAFNPTQVFLDAGMHDGLHRPPLVANGDLGPTASAAAPNVTATALGRLLTGPEPLPAVVALDFAALHRNLLPRLLKQLCREGYTLHAATSCVLRDGGAAAAAMPALAGQPAVLLHVSRSNAVLHLRSLAAALATAAVTQLSGSAAGGSGAAGNGVHTCGTWREAAAVLSDVWPTGGEGAGSVESTAPRLVAAGGVQRRFVRPGGSRLLQLTAMTVTPSTDVSDGGPPALDWPRLADALDVLHAEGFRVASLRAAAVGPRDLSDLVRASCRIAPRQQQAVQAAAAAATAAAPGAAGGSRAAPPPSNIALMALARDNAVTALQILLDEAGRVAASNAQGQAGRGVAVAAVVPAPASRGPGQRGAAAALAPLAACASVSHSPAAAEQQVTAVFEGVFGAGGVALVQ